MKFQLEEKKDEGVERRSQLQIYADILRLIQKRGGLVKPTHILYGANLSHARLTKHLNWLLEKNFITEDMSSGHKLYRLTPKGKAFIEEFRKIEDFSEAFGVPV
jgi:predicted transcriptional regulator